MDFSNIPGATDSLEDFTGALAGSAPVPGGGGAAALAGALAISLGSMVANFTVGKAKYADFEQLMRTDLIVCKRLRKRLLALIEEDAKAFEPLSKAYAIPKDNPDREEILEEATKEAIKAPLEILEICGRVTDILLEMKECGSKMLLSDAGCGAALAKGAMESAAMNIYINTKSLKDREYAEKINKKTGDILKSQISLAEQIVADVFEALSN